ncbi:MAG TPA: SUMF1/EgtB/PvdO family nonheme iron enzyme, partial [Terriglobales bacterium]|nr:SUMF1/EgtB/PvdO family nonheme iron enzyme [Terriglobales bacterium]
MAGVVARWRAAQAASDQLWQVLKPQAITRRPVPERHRLVFYLGHLEAFDWNLLAPALEQQPFHPEWDKLFAFGIDPVDGQLPSDPAEAWPAEAEISAYNRRVRQQLGDTLARQGGEAAAQRLEVAIEHRWMHVETLSYLFHNLDYADKLAGPAPAPGRAALPAAEMIPIPAGKATLGRQRQEGFGWDNEFDAHEVAVSAFGAARRKVSNREYLDFVAAGAAA